MPKTTTPPQITPEILKLCSAVNPGQIPIFIPVLPDQYSQIDHCFFNVKDKCEREGGIIEYGWAIWEWPAVLIEAEFHAVWKKPDGNLIDISKRVEGQILFLKDEKRTYDFNKNGYRVDNIRKPISNSPLVREYIGLAEEKFQIEERFSFGSEVRVPKDLYYPILFRMKELMDIFFHGMGMGKIGRNSPCPCGSGLKYKKCCQR